MNKHELDTPALLVYASRLASNIERMQELAGGFGVRLRPHTKTHKSPRIARWQVEAGAAGITVAKLGEAEVMADAGLDDILIANQVIGEEKMRRLASLAARVRLALLVDSDEGVRQADAAAGRAGAAIDVLVEVDTGKGRCGLADVGEIAKIADLVAARPHLGLRGIETHEGHVAGGEGPDAMRDLAVEAGSRAVQIAEELRSRGHEVREISVGSTPAAPYTAAVKGITEIRPGTYVFNDVNQMAIGQATTDDCCLRVLATVISRPAADRAVLDAGSKSLFSEPVRNKFAWPDYSGYGHLPAHRGARIASLSEEHAVVHVPGGMEFPAVGSKVEVIPNHVCPAVNLHEVLHVVEGDEVVDSWPVAARGKIR